MKKLFLLMLLLVVAIAGQAGYARYQKSEEVKEVTALMRDASTGVVNQLEYFKDPRGATFRDALNASEGHLKELDGMVLRLQGRAAPRDKAVVDHAVDYVKACQESVRRARGLMLARVEAKVAMELLRGTGELLQEFVSNPGDERNKFKADVASYSTDAVIKRADKAASDLQLSSDALGKALSGLFALKNTRPAVIPADIYVPADKVQNISVTVGQ